MKVKTDYDKCGYITAGKAYEINAELGSYRAITDDEGETIWIKLSGNGCPHLHGGNWVVISPDEKSFDVTKHEFSDAVGFVECDGAELTLNCGTGNNYIDLYKDDAIAIAKALVVTGDDLK